MSLTASQMATKLRGIERTIERLTYVPRRVAVIAAPGLNTLIQAGFSAGTDPYGRPWRELKPSTIATGRRNPPLTGFTRRLRSNSFVRPRSGNRAGLDFNRLEASVPYAVRHQIGFHVGKTYVAPRRFVPQFGLPLGWSRVLRESTRQAFEEAARG